jgi:hypothetical protein
VAGKTALTVLCVCLIVSPFVLNVDDYDFSREGTDVRLGLAGPVFFDHEQREFFLRQAEEMVAAARALPPGSVLLAGDWSPYGDGLAVTDGAPELADRILGGLSSEEVQGLQAEGLTVYYLASAETALRDRWGLDLEGLGVGRLDP